MFTCLYYVASIAICRVEGREETQNWPQLRLRDPLVSLQVSGPFLSQLRGNTLFHEVEQSRGTTEKVTGKEQREEAKIRPEKEC